MAEESKTPDIADLHRLAPGAATAAALAAIGEAMSAEDVEAREALEAAPTLADRYDLTAFELDSSRTLISLANLPMWPGGAEDSGHGWGRALDGMLGGGVCPGYMLAVGAASAGAGKTAWIHQLADGLALRTLAQLEGAEARAEPLTPVLFLSEMRADGLTWRSLARWTGKSASDFRAGASHHERDSVAAAAREAFDSEWGRSRSFIRLWQGNALGGELPEALARTVDAWKAELEAKHGREVWPVVVIDPLQRFRKQGNTGEVEAVNELVAALGKRARADGWVVLLTSDTNKTSATGDGRDSSRTILEEGAAALRGTYQLTHEADAVIYLKREEDGRTVRAHVVKNRWGRLSDPKGNNSPAFMWDGAAMRFEAETVTVISSTGKSYR